MKEDTNNVVYAIIFLQGLACQFPWNALITATRYYDLKLTEWPTAKHFISHFAIIFMSLKFACMLASMTVGRAVDPGRRAFWSGLTMCTGVAVLLALSLLDTIPMTVFYGVTLAMVGVMALGSAWSEIAILEILAGMPPRLTQAYLAGQSVAGVVVCLHGLALLAWYGGMRETGEVQEFAIAYFGITMTVCGVALVLLTSLEHLPHFRYLEQRKKMSLINLHIKQEVTDNNEGKEKDTNDGLSVQDKSMRGQRQRHSLRSSDCGKEGVEGDGSVLHSSCIQHVRPHSPHSHHPALPSSPGFLLSPRLSLLQRRRSPCKVPDRD